MRLRVWVERHKLPPVRAIWPVIDSKATVAQLLQSLDGVFPLEAESWGLEDYSISVAGFELLHYHELQNVCKDDDEIVVKPLGYSEVRARYATGRDQITADGRHLIDGVPFGKVALRGSVRPQLRIAPRGLDNYTKAGDEMLMLTENNETLDSNDDDDYDDDDDFEVTGVRDGDDDASELLESTQSSCTDLSVESTNTDDDESSSQHDTHVSDSETGSSLTHSESSWEGIPTTPKQNTSSAHNPTSIAQSPSSGMKRKRHSGDGGLNEESPHHKQAVEQSKPSGIPFQGLSRTKARNARRKDTNRLKYLVASNILPAGSTLVDLRFYDETAQAMEKSITIGQEPLITSTNTSSHQKMGAETEVIQDNGAPSAFSAESGGKYEKNMSDSNGNGAAKKRKQSKPSRETSEDLQQQRRELINQIANGGVDVTSYAKKVPSNHERANTASSDMAVLGTDVDEAKQGLSSRGISADHFIQKAASSSAATMVPPSVMHRARLDVTSSQRLVFGSLGLRAPKTQEQRDQLQLKLAERANSKVAHRKPNTMASATDLDSAAEGKEGDGPEPWNAKINLSAVECCSESVVLSTPPFPFRQNWNKSATAKGKKRRTTTQETTYVETYDKYNRESNCDALDYDDAADIDEDYWEDGTFLENGDHESDNDEDQDADFPPVPNDITTLPKPNKEAFQPGDLIVFEELACDATTGWQPKTARRSARIVKLGTEEKDEPGSCWGYLKLAKRDLAPIHYDNQGNRIYSKFENPDDDSNNTPQPRNFEDLTNVRLLLRVNAA